MGGHPTEQDLLHSAGLWCCRVRPLNVFLVEVVGGILMWSQAAYGFFLMMKVTPAHYRKKFLEILETRKNLYKFDFKW